MMLLRRLLAHILAGLIALAPMAQAPAITPVLSSVAVTVAFAAPLVTPQHASALTTAEKPVILGGVQGWSLRGSSLDLYFARNAGSCAVNRHLVSCASLLTTTRASTELAPWADQHWSSFASGAPAQTDLGLSIWMAATNTALWSRDLTNAAWVKTTMTTALTATGIDGSANSATTLTATAGNATALQTLTIGSTAETFSIFVERISGTGNIQITEDNGTTWTTMTSANCVNTSGVGTAINATSFVRCSVEAVLANPVIGVRIVTNGDSVAVDVAQNEASNFSTPPIITTSASAARSADVITLAGAAQTAALSAQAALFQTKSISGIAFNNRLLTYNSGANVQINTVSLASMVNNSAAGATAIPGSSLFLPSKIAVGFDASSVTIVANAGTPGSNAVAVGALTAPIYLGGLAAGNRQLNGILSRATLGPVKGQFDGLTSP